jgi:predicted ribosomally synthesized peptide with nif11-like leader
MSLEQLKVFPGKVKKVANLQDKLEAVKSPEDVVITAKDMVIYSKLIK